MDLTALPLYDHHSHALFHEAAWRREPLEGYFTEATDSGFLARFGRDNLAFRRAVRELAAFYGCPPTVEALYEARRRVDYPALVRRMFAEARLEEGSAEKRVRDVSDSTVTRPRAGDTFPGPRNGAQDGRLDLALGLSE